MTTIRPHPMFRRVLAADPVVSTVGARPRADTGGRDRTPELPRPRGPLSETIISYLAGETALETATPVPTGEAALTDDDLHLALWICNELHHHGFAGVDDAVEWDAQVLTFRRRLEGVFEAALRLEHDRGVLPVDPVEALVAIGDWAGPPLSSTVAEAPDRQRICEFVIHRSAYQLKEADAHTFGLPRLAGRGRAAMIEIQMDEYGGGVPGAAHAEIFAAAMRELGLDDRLGAYVDLFPGTTLATDNLVELFGLHRRLRGALIGHLAVFETTSVVPMSRYLEAARHLGDAPSLERFYAVHVEADAHHGRLAITDMVEGFLADEPGLADEVVFGAAALHRVEARFGSAMLDCWARGSTSLRVPSTVPLPVG